MREVRAPMSGSTQKPYIIRRNGDIVHREGGHTIGRIVLTTFGWSAETLADRVGRFGSRERAAREIWDRVRR